MTEIRVGGNRAINVRPYLNALGIQARADDGSAKVRSAAPQRCANTFPCGGDKAAHDRYAFAIKQWLHGFRQTGVCLFKLWNGFAEACVSHDAPARINMRGLNV